jgi:hypothetical protein
MIHKLFLLLFASLAGCSSSGFLSSGGSTVEIHSMGLDRVILEANCTTIVCTEGFANEGDVWMTDIPIDQLKSGEYTDGQIIQKLRCLQLQRISQFSTPLFLMGMLASMVVEDSAGSLGLLKQGWF